jgi:hypothetical protein
MNAQLADIIDDTEIIQEDYYVIDPKNNSTIKKARALDVYSESGDVNEACKAASITKSSWYRWQATDEDFAIGIIKARQHIANVLEREAIRRALAKSDLLLIFLLKGLNPTVYHDRMSIDNTHQVKANDPGRSRLSDKDIDVLIAQAESLKHARKTGKDDTPVDCTTPLQITG